MIKLYDHWTVKLTSGLQIPTNLRKADFKLIKDLFYISMSHGASDLGEKKHDMQTNPNLRHRSV